MNYSEDFKQLRKSLVNNTLTIFVGSGVSRNSDCVTWKQIIEKFAKELGIEHKEPYYKKSFEEKNMPFALNETFDNMIKIPQIYFNKFGEQKYYNELTRLFDTKHFPNNINKFLMGLKPKNFITTNYDTLIEDSAREQMEAYEVISSDLHIKPMNSDRLIIKIHGDLKQKNLVLKEDDYLNYSKNFRITESLIKGILATNVTLFIGYSLSDYNIKLIMADIPHEESSKPRAYFINLDGNYEKLDEEYYLRKGIKVLYVKKALGINSIEMSQFEQTLIEFLKLAFESSLNESQIDDALEILEPYKNFYLGRNGIQSLLNEFGVKKSNDDYNLYPIPNLDNRKTLTFFSEIQDKLNLNKLEPYLTFNNITGLNFSDYVAPIINSDICNFKFIHEYDINIPLEKALQFYYLGSYPKSYEIFSTIFKKATIEKDYLTVAISSYNIRKMNYFYDLSMAFEPAYEISTDELDFILVNIPKNYNYLNRFYSHEVVFKYTHDIFHASLKINKMSKQKDVDFLNRSLISFVNFITFNKVALDERLNDVSDILYFAILKILQSDEDVLLEDYHVYLIYIFFSTNLMKKIKSEYGKPLKMENPSMFIEKLMKDWDLQLESTYPCDRLYTSLRLFQLLNLDSNSLTLIEQNIKKFSVSITARYAMEINKLMLHINREKLQE